MNKKHIKSSSILFLSATTIPAVFLTTSCVLQPQTKNSTTTPTSPALNSNIQSTQLNSSLYKILTFSDEYETGKKCQLDGITSVKIKDKKRFDSVTHPIAYLPGKIFKYWAHSDNTPVKTSDSVWKSNETLHPVFTDTTECTIEWDKGTGELTKTSDTVNLTETFLNIEKPVATKNTNAAFVGWYDQSGNKILDDTKLIDLIDENFKIKVTCKFTDDTGFSEKEWVNLTFTNSDPLARVAGNTVVAIQKNSTFKNANKPKYIKGSYIIEQYQSGSDVILPQTIIDSSKEINCTFALHPYIDGDKVYTYFHNEGQYGSISNSTWDSTTSDIVVVLSSGQKRTFSRSSFNEELFFGKQMTAIPDNFLCNCTSYNLPISIPSNITKIGKNFINGCTSFTSSVTLPATVTTIDENFISNQVAAHCSLVVSSENTSFGSDCGLFYNKSTNDILLALKDFDGKTWPSFITKINDGFLSGNTVFNKEITLPSTITEIGDDFLKGCTGFNSKITFSSSITKVGKNFLSGCTSFNQPITLPELEATPDLFLNNCTSFNQTISFPSTVTKIGSSFLNNCTTFNKTLTLPSTITEIGDSFLSGCTSFTYKITFSANIKTIGDSFLSGCTKFTNSSYNLSLPTNLESIGNCFMKGCTGFKYGIIFNSKIKTIGDSFMEGCTYLCYSSSTFTLTSSTLLTTIGSNFLKGCTNFNSTINLSYCTAITTIGDSFLEGCTKFNVALNLSNLTKLNKIGKNFLKGCTAFCRTVTIPAAEFAENSIGPGFMYGCNAYTSSSYYLYFNCPATSFALPTDEGDLDSFYWTTAKSSSYYFYIKGSTSTESSNLIARFPAIQRSGYSTYYRRLKTRS